MTLSTAFLSCKILKPWSSRWSTDFFSFTLFHMFKDLFFNWHSMKICLLETKKKKSWYKNSPQRQTKNTILKLIRKLNWPLIHLNRNILSWCLEFWWTIISLSKARLTCEARRIMILHKIIFWWRTERRTDGQTKKY